MQWKSAIDSNRSHTTHANLIPSTRRSLAINICIESQRNYAPSVTIDKHTADNNETLSGGNRSFGARDRSATIFNEKYASKAMTMDRLRQSRQQQYEFESLRCIQVKLGAYLPPVCRKVETQTLSWKHLDQCG